MIYLLTSIIRFPWWWHIITVVICTTLKHFPWMPWPKWHASHQHPRQPFERPTVSSMRPKCASPKARLHLYHHAKMPWLRHAPSRFSLETRLWENWKTSKTSQRSTPYCFALLALLHPLLIICHKELYPVVWSSAQLPYGSITCDPCHQKLDKNDSCWKDVRFRTRWRQHKMLGTSGIAAIFWRSSPHLFFRHFNFQCACNTLIFIFYNAGTKYTQILCEKKHDI